MSFEFKKRHYRSLRELWQDLSFPFHHRSEIRQAMSGSSLSPAFRERLMLIVTAATGCQYCASYHTGEALKAGLSEQEIRTFLAGTVDNAPAEELPALLYAQHWSELDANPDPAVRKVLIDTYGVEQSGPIEMVLRLIRTANLLGNTYDYLLFRLSFGRWKGRNRNDAGADPSIE